MKFILNNDKLTIQEPECNNSGSINYYLVDVEANEQWEGLNIVAVLTPKEGSRCNNQGRTIAIINNQLYIDNSISGYYAIGFMGFTIDYSSTQDITIDPKKTYYTRSGQEGSYIYTKVENPVIADIGTYYEAFKSYQISTDLQGIWFNQGAGEIEITNDDIPTPTEWEVYVAQMQEFINNGNEIVEEANNLNIEVEKVDTTTTITITKKDGTEESVEILDGEKGDKGDKGDAGAIKMLIVAELPQTGADDTIYLVPITPDTSGNNYAEYVYINNAWELLGKIGVQVDLTDYVKNTDYASSSVAGVFKPTAGYNLEISSSNGILYCSTNTYSGYGEKSNSCFISKGTLENVITGKELVNKTYVDNIVGNIESILTTLDVGGGIE